MKLRALRRHHLARMKAKARKVYGRYHQDNIARCDKWANHLHLCSGPCCGNPRYWFGEPTMQERRAFECA